MALMLLPISAMALAVRLSDGFSAPTDRRFSISSSRRRPKCPTKSPFVGHSPTPARFQSANLKRRGERTVQHHIRLVRSAIIAALSLSPNMDLSPQIDPTTPLA
jgi:hypothetical protein